MKKRLLYISVITVLAVLLSACGEEKTVLQEYIETEVTEQTLSELAVNAQLTKLHIINSDCYDAIERFIAENPQVQVSYELKLGDAVINNTDEQLKIDGADPQTVYALSKYVPYLKNLNSITVSSPLSPEEIRALRESFPNAALTYCTVFCGETLSGDAESLDLSEITDRDGFILNANSIAELFPKLSAVNTVKADGTDDWSVDELSALCAALPDSVNIKCTVELYGRTLSSDDEEIIFEKAGLSNEDLDAARKVLPLLAGCRRFVMDNCGPSYEELAKLRDEFPDKGVAWRVHFNADSLLTDEKILWSTYVRDENCHVLNYCTELEYVDLGHDEWLSDISFTQYMPKLKVLIIGITAVSDLSPLSNCPELEYLEIFRTKATDISPLAACTKLEHLNMSLMEVRDLSPLYGLKNLKRLWCMNSYCLSTEQKEEIQKQLPDCEFCFRDGDSLTAFGWRTLDDGTEAQRYALLKEQMQYGGYNSPRDKVDYDKMYQKGYA